MKKIRLTSGLTLIFFIVFALYANMANANFTPLPELPPPIIIQKDGSINPSTAPLAHVGNIYTLTGNVNNTIEVQCSNIVLDGNGFSITNPPVNTQGLMTPVGWLPGVHLNGANNVTVTDVTFEDCITGVRVEENSTYVTIINNRVRGTLSGIVVFSASHVNIVENDFALTQQSFALAMHFLPSSPQENYPSHLQIEGNHILGTGQEAPTTVMQPNQYGVWGGFTDSKMVNNNFTRIQGIALYNIGADNQIVGNTFQENNQGVTVNMDPDVWQNNHIYGNNFINNCENAVVGFIRNWPINFWDNGTVGNYWSDYKGADNNGDGIGDSPYLLETTYTDYEQNRNVTVENGRDNYPAMEPFNLPSITVQQPQQTTLPTSTLPSTGTAEGQVGTTEQPAGFLNVLHAAVIGVAVLVCASLFFLFKRRDHPVVSLV
ncbi:MAG: nitrous oxide reductase family maturation protein NosD [Candidatus Bathyarchaeia archaeon]|jgi:hypothetical protein